MRNSLAWAAALTVAVAVGCSKPPQIGGDEESMGAADALWTAVTSKRPPLLERCAEKIERLHAAGKLPDEPYEVLSGIVATARGGDWTAARTSLKWFLRGQRPAAKAQHS